MPFYIRHWNYLTGKRVIFCDTNHVGYDSLKAGMLVLFVHPDSMDIVVAIILFSHADADVANPLISSLCGVAGYCLSFSP